jgi:uncharacterized membrane protein
MGPLDAFEAVAGFLLLFFVPGFALAKAMFPEWRVRGALALRRAVELVTLSFVLSVVLTVLVGYLLLNTAPAGFQADWSHPVLEAALAAVALVALFVGLWEGAYRRHPPARPPSRARADRGEEGAWELTVELDRLMREERRVEHALRRSPHSSPEERALQSRLIEIRSERDELGRRREEEYAE